MSSDHPATKADLREALEKFERDLTRNVVVLFIIAMTAVVVCSYFFLF